MTLKNPPPADPTANIPMRQMKNIMPGVADQFLIKRWNSYGNTTLSNRQRLKLIKEDRQHRRSPTKNTPIENTPMEPSVTSDESKNDLDAPVSWEDMHAVDEEEHGITGGHGADTTGGLKGDTDMPNTSTDTSTGGLEGGSGTLDTSTDISTGDGPEEDPDTLDTSTDIPYQELCDILGQDKTDEDLAAFYGSVRDQMGLSDDDILSYIQSVNGDNIPSSNDKDVSNDSNWIDTHDDSLDGDDIKSGTPDVFSPVKPIDNQYHLDCERINLH